MNYNSYDFSKGKAWCVPGGDAGVEYYTFIRTVATNITKMGFGMDAFISFPGKEPLAEYFFAMYTYHEGYVRDDSNNVANELKENGKQILFELLQEPLNANVEELKL